MLNKTTQFIPISCKCSVSQLHQFFVQVRWKDIRDNFCVELLETKYQTEIQFPKDYVFYDPTIDHPTKHDSCISYVLLYIEINRDK